MVEMIYKMRGPTMSTIDDPAFDLCDLNLEPRDLVLGPTFQILG